jgi:hypothetical protein
MIKKSISTLLVATTLTTMGCSSLFIAPQFGSESIALVDASEVKSCELKSSVTLSVLSKVWFVNRNEKSVENNLLQMARNSAIESKADTIVKGESKRFGERLYSLYRCKYLNKPKDKN